jgi:hypothetical protein
VMSSSPAKEVAVPGAAPIVFGSSWEYGCGLGVPTLLLARQFGCVEPRSRFCLAFRFFARLVMPESNWVRFGPQSLPALAHLVHFSLTLPSHLRSGGLHYPPSDLRLGKTSKLTSSTTREERAGVWRPKTGALGLGLGDPSNRMEKGEKLLTFCFAMRHASHFLSALGLVFGDSII